MNYQTLFNDAIGWLFSDITRCMWIIGGLAIIGAINGVRISLNHCKHTGRGRMHVL